MVVFAGGGTGGHLYPAIAIADALRARSGEEGTPEVVFIGTADRLEAALVPRAGYRLETVSAKPFSRSLQFAVSNIAGVLRSLRLLRRIQPDIVIATGGYVCFPVVVAARLLRFFRQMRAPIALLEPNAQAGLTNRVLAPLVDEIWCAYEPDGVKSSQKTVRTGVPVRASLRSVAAIPKEAARAQLGIDIGRRVLLAIGGSQGARSVNDAVVQLVVRNLLPADWQVLLVAGAGEFDRVAASVENASAAIRIGQGREALRVVSYIDDMANAYAAADLVLARSGASTLAELEAARVPAILVPYPLATENHQETNARVVERTGAAVVLIDDRLDADGLQSIFEEVRDPERLAAMRAAFPPDAGGAVERILARIDGLLSRKGA